MDDTKYCNMVYYYVGLCDLQKPVWLIKHILHGAMFGNTLKVVLFILQVVLTQWLRAHQACLL